MRSSDPSSSDSKLSFIRAECLFSACLIPPEKKSFYRGADRDGKRVKSAGLSDGVDIEIWNMPPRGFAFR
jgi:hypothetical protein